MNRNLIAILLAIIYIVGLTWLCWSLPVPWGFIVSLSALPVGMVLGGLVYNYTHPRRY